MSHNSVKVIALTIAVLTMGSCGAQGRLISATSATVSQSLPRRDIIAELRIEAHSRGLRWRIVCGDRDDGPCRYDAYAAPILNNEKAFYSEDGALPEWQGMFIDHHFYSQEEAAEWLLKAIKGAPTHVPPSRVATTCKGSEIGGQ